MGDREIRQKLTQALSEPEAPRALVERTVVRAEAIAAGRAAERQLTQMGDAQLERKDRRLAAQAVLGRLMLLRQPPADAKLPDMVRQLEENDSFAQAVQGSAAELLSQLQSGRIFRKFQQPEHTKTAAPKAPEREQPTLERKTPADRLPGL